MSDDLTPTIERLQTALRETADQLEVGAFTELGPSGLTGTRRRGPILFAAAAIIAAVVVLGGAALLRADRDGSRVETPATAEIEQLTPDQLSHLDADLEVYMDVTATDVEIETVHRLIERDRRVSRFAYLDRDAAFVEFAEIFSDEPALIANTQPEDLPPSFRIELSDPEDLSLGADLEVIEGVNDVQQPTRPFVRNHG